MVSNPTRFEPKSLGVAIRLAGWATIAGLIWTGNGAAAQAQSDAGSEATPPAARPSVSKAATKGVGDGRVVLEFKGASWNRVLKRIAKHGGMDVVMKSSPPGTFTCGDPSEHTIPDALRMVNRQLEPRGFRAIQQGRFLVVINLDGLRSGYNSPSFVRHAQSNTSDEAASQGTSPTNAAGRATTGAVQVSATAYEAPGSGNTPAVLELNADGTPAKASGSSPADSIQLKGESDPTAKEPEKEQSKDAQDLKIEKADTTPQIRIFFMAAKWPEVLQCLSEQSGLTLVMKKCPSGAVKFRDWTKHTTSEIISCLNHELEEDQSNFRLVRQDSFLMVINKDDLRSEYERPTAGHLRKPVHSEVEVINDTPPAPVAPTQVQVQVPASEPGVVRASANTFPEDAVETQRARTIEPVRLERAADAPELLPAPSGAESAESAQDTSSAGNLGGGAHVSRAEQIFAPSSNGAAADQPAGHATGSTYVPQHRRVEAIARRLYTILKGRADLVDSGPENLPSFRVFEAHGLAGVPSSKGRLACTVGIDTEHNRLVIDAPAPKRAALLRVFACLDGAEPAADEGLHLVSADVTRAAIAKNVTTALNQIVAQNIQSPVAPPPEQTPGRATLQVAPGSTQDLGEMIKGLKGEVTVESVPELGILILRGNPVDVDAVMKVIRQVEKLGRGAAPQITILPLQFVNSESFAKLMNQVYADLHGIRVTDAAAKPQIKFYAIVKPNAVLVIAPPSELAGVKELTAQLDKPVIPETEFQVFPLKHGFAAAIAKSVNDFYKGRNGLGTVVEAVSDARTNSVIVQARPRDLEEVAKLITRLDGPTASQATVKIYQLTNGDASTIVRLLNQLFLPTGQQGAGGGGAVQTAQSAESSPTTLRITADVRTNSIIAVGSPETLQAIYAVILRLDNTDAHQRKTVVIKLKNNSSDAVQKAISDFVTSERSVAQIDPDVVSTVELLEREVFIVSETLSNSLLLSATPRYFEELKKMIDKLDAAPTQVIIQAMIVEVTLTNDDEFGIELGFQSPVLFDRSTLQPPVTFTTTTSQNTNTTVANQINLSTTAAPGFQFTDPAQGVDGLGTNSIVNKGTVGTQELTNFGVGRTSQNGYGSGLVLAASSESVSFLLRALSYKESIHVLSRPMIRTVDNVRATVQVGKNVPIINGFIPVGTAGALAPIVRQDSAGIILTVTPRITPEGMVVMSATIEKSQYESGPSGGVVLVTDPITGRTITSPIKDITHTETTVSLASGETVVMGGLITSSDDTVERKAPWLGDVPIVGQLFRYDTKTTIRTELLIFLTPRVIRNDADDEALKQIETERLHFMLDEAEAIHGPILSTQPPADGLMQQVPPLTMPSGNVPPAPGVGPSITPPASIRSGQQQALPPELPPVMQPGTPAPGISPTRPGVAPKPIPRETNFDDPSIPTTQMPADAPHDLKPLRTTSLTGQTLGQPFTPRPATVDQSGVAHFPFQPSDADTGAASTGK